MKSINQKLKIILPILTILLVTFLFWFYGSGDEEKDFIDLKNNEIIKNEDEVVNVNITNREMVQVRFSWEVGGIKYSDALNIPKGDYQKLREEDIEKMKEERFQNWVKMVNEQSKLDEIIP